MVSERCPINWNHQRDENHRELVGFGSASLLAVASDALMKLTACLTRAVYPRNDIRPDRAGPRPGRLPGLFFGAFAAWLILQVSNNIMPMPIPRRSSQPEVIRQVSLALESICESSSRRRALN
jgi:hypothetical protein